MTPYVKSHNEHGITTIEFFHPQSNSLPGRILEELAQEIHFSGVHEETKVIILRSDGTGAFCAGASIDELSAISNVAEGINPAFASHGTSGGRPSSYEVRRIQFVEPRFKSPRFPRRNPCAR